VCTAAYTNELIQQVLAENKKYAVAVAVGTMQHARPPTMYPGLASCCQSLQKPMEGHKDPPFFKRQPTQGLHQAFETSPATAATVRKLTCSMRIPAAFESLTTFATEYQYA
jgi:hypothetical protein